MNKLSVQLPAASNTHNDHCRSRARHGIDSPARLTARSFRTLGEQPAAASRCHDPQTVSGEAGQDLISKAGKGRLAHLEVFGLV